MSKVFIYFCVGVTVLFFLMQPLTLSAREYPDSEGDFFSLEKYAYTYSYFYHLQQADLSTASFLQRRVGKLAKRFVSGFDALKEAKIDKAISDFKKASGLLPEYFHTDFAIALCYEGKGDFKDAAKFYKSYLEKLKKFDKGMFRITQSLIEKTVDFNIPGYKEAEGLVGQRMAKYGIDMKKVPATRYPPLLIIIIIVITVGALLYLALQTGPAKRLLYKTKRNANRSKETWVCLYCGKENANINLKCYNCGKAPKT